MASITIPLYYDLDLLLWTSAAGGIARQPNLVLGQSDSIAFAVQFVRSGVVIELTSPAWICGIKPINDVAGDYLCQTTTGVQTGSGASTVYTFTLLLDSTELRAWLLTVTAVSNYAAFSIRDTVNLIATLPAITCTILPDYTLEGTTPTDASGTLIVDSGQTFTVHKSFAMPTTDGFNNYVLKTNGAGVGSWAVDSAGTGTVTNVAVTTANGVSGTVANPTTNAAITLTLGAITPTTGAFSDETDATNATTAPLKTAGGLAVAKTLYVGEGIQVLGTSNRSTITDELLVGGDLLVRYLTSYAGETILDLSPVASSVNYVTIEPSVTGSPVHIYAQGTDSNIGLHLSPKGTGFVNVEDGTDTTKRLRFGASGNSTGIITTLASSSTTSQTITLPNATGATTLAGLQMVQTFTAAQTFSSTVGLTLGTDATNSSTGGTLTVTGGAAVSKKLYVGLAATIGGALTVGGHILPSLDNVYDIGQNGPPRFRDFYCVGIATMQRIICSANAQISEIQDYGNSAAYMKTAYDSTHDFYLFNRTTTHIPFSINAVTSQTADLFHCYVNTVQKFAVTKDGSIVLASQASQPASPTAGTIIFNSTTKKLNFYTGTAWEAVTSS